MELLFLVLILIGWLLVLRLLWTSRPDPDAFIERHDLDPAAREQAAAALMRTHRTRRDGALVGFALALVTSVLVVGRIEFGPLQFLGALGGAFLGIGLAQFPRRRASEAVRRAVLAPRALRDYLSPRERVGPFFLVIIVIAGCAVIAIGAPAPSADLHPWLVCLALVALAAALGGIGLEMLVVERGHPIRGADPAVNEALRMSAVRGIHHATVGFLLCVLALTASMAGTAATVQHSVVVDGKIVFTAPDGSTHLEVTGSDPDRATVSWFGPVEPGSGIPVDPGLTAAEKQQAERFARWLAAEGRANTTTRGEEATLIATQFETIRIPPGAQVEVGDVILNDVWWWTAVVVSVLATIAALFQWHAAAGAWKETGPRGRRMGRTQATA